VSRHWIRSAAIPLLLLAGCATTTENPGFEVLSTSRATGPLPADAVFPATGGDWIYLVTTGAGAGERLAHRRESTDRYRAAWADREADRRSEYWRLDEAGNVVMPVVVDHDDKAITFFDPPLVLAYSRLEPGRQYEQAFTMRVMDERRPERQRDLGTGTQTIVYADDQVLKTPLGRLATKRIVVRFTADLKMAGAETTTTLYVIPGVGAVVIQRRETVRLMGVLIRNRNQTQVLTSSPVPLPKGDRPL
jgi:hypothetical protein